MDYKKRTPVLTMLVISTGFVIVFFISRFNWALFVSLITGLIGILSPFLSRKIDFYWMKLAWLLSLIVPNILLSIIFYFILFPVSLLAKVVSKKDYLFLKNVKKSTFKKESKVFDKCSFEKMW